jgi:beta-carotene 15,15'-dioxygenase
MKYMNLLRIQGVVFIIIAGTVALASTLFLPFEGETTLMVLAIFILLLGVPHGALDPVFAARIYTLRKPFSWACFVCIYLLLALSVVLLWRVAPLLFLSGFLVISLVHFSGDLIAGTVWPVRMLYGGAPIVLPTLIHAREVIQIFSFLIDPISAQILVHVLALCSLPWLVALLLACVHQLRVNTLTAIEIAAVGMLAVSAPPLVSFTVFFCCMHSPRHLLRTLQHAPMYSGRRLCIIALGPLLGVGVLLLAGAALLTETAQDAKLIQIIFVGLAALTVPHMLLVERVRFYGWPESTPHG